ncbi:hypothetical protein [Cytobacillus firmus]|uniref:Uncharacterized protein n=1 Tax=Cytobacillus firmus DS1 TaxID=1307436 RepID=W7KN36_CYTFI|nr:hypothetical protein [Cytobacillus firmus]EWG08880.1 hypothetical protein PBF_21988 [Cytobacillus firmus DS1]
MKKDLEEMAKKLERYQEYFDTRGEEILKLRKENERLSNALLRFVEDETVTWEQTESIAKRALKLPPYQ